MIATGILQSLTRFALIVLPMLNLLYGCGGMNSFPHQARAGDTISIATGWMETFDRESVTVTITAADGNTTTYAPGDPAVRAIIHLYPDPLSYIMVGNRTDQNYDYGYGDSYGGIIDDYTGNDPDWHQTLVLLDLPTTLSTGIATIELKSAAGEYYTAETEILDGLGERDDFEAEGLGPMTAEQLHSLERAPSHVVRISGDGVLPASLQLEMIHDADISAGGTGVAYVVNPRPEQKNISWSDDGTNMRVLITPAGDGTWEDADLAEIGWNRYKFYVTGGITNVQITSFQAYDLNGAPLTGVTASVTPR